MAIELLGYLQIGPVVMYILMVGPVIGWKYGVP